MSEQAKRAAKRIVDSMNSGACTKPFDSGIIFNVSSLIDAEFAEVFKERDDLKLTLKRLRLAIVNHAATMTDCKDHLKELNAEDIANKMAPTQNELARALLVAKKLTVRK